MPLLGKGGTNPDLSKSITLASVVIAVLSFVSAVLLLIGAIYVSFAKALIIYSINFVSFSGN